MTVALEGETGKTGVVSGLKRQLRGFKGTCCQAGRPEFNPQGPHDRSKELANTRAHAHIFKGWNHKLHLPLLSLRSIFLTQLKNVMSV